MEPPEEKAYTREELRLYKKRLSYHANAEKERLKARERFRRRITRRLASFSAEELEQHREKHREAQARYRERNKVMLMIKSARARRLGKKKPKDAAVGKPQQTRAIISQSELASITQWSRKKDINSGGSPISDVDQDSSADEG